MVQISMDASISEAVKERAQRIKVLLMDCDGVLTDGKVYYLPIDGEPVEFKGFNTQDGLGFHILNAVGIKTGVISGRESPALVERARNLKISYVFQGLLDKEGAFNEILADAGCTAEEVSFIGDDFTDAPLMIRCGLACAVSNARPELFSVAHLVTKARGGEGAVREVIEVILKSKNLWPHVLEKFGLQS